MQMHPGVSGAPHVTQPGAMMGMQPGAMNAQHPGAGMAMQAQLAAHGMQNPQLGQMTPAQIQHLQQQQQQAAQLTAQSKYYQPSAPPILICALTRTFVENRLT